MALLNVGCMEVIVLTELSDYERLRNNDNLILDGTALCFTFAAL